MARTTPQTTPSRNGRVPKYRLHKASGQAIVQIKGNRIYLGKYGTEKSRKRYAEEIANLETPQPVYGASTEATADYTVVELAANYLDYAEQYYTKDGEPTESARKVGRAIRLAAEHYGSTPVVDFGPLKLKRLVSKMIDSGLSRGMVNKRMRILKRMFRWGVAEELVPAHIWQALDAVEGVHKGRTPAP